MMKKTIRLEYKPVCAAEPRFGITWEVHRWKLLGVTVWRVSYIHKTHWPRSHEYHG